MTTFRQRGQRTAAVTGLPTDGVPAQRPGDDRTTDGADAEAVAQQLAAIIEGTDDAVIALSLDGTITGWNRGAENIYGYTAEQAIGQPGAMLLPPHHPDDVTRILDDIREGRHVEHFETLRMRSDRSVFHVSLTVSPIHNGAGEVVGVSSIARDITDRLAAEELRQQLETELRWQALHDGMTCLPNRTLFIERARHALNRRDPRSVVICFLDLDDFKQVNDTYGHAAGDELLFEIGVRLRECLRPEDTVARFGGEFAILLEDITLADVEVIVDRIQRSAREPVRLRDTEVIANVSIGLTASNGSDSSVEQLIAEADAAMYAAKAHSGPSFEIFNPAMQTAYEGRSRLRLEIDEGLSDEQFRIYFQPIVDLEAGVRQGHEALVRWQHPRRGIVMPAEFIEYAEASGQIASLGAWVLTTVCSIMADKNPDEQVSVNVSARQLMRTDLGTIVESALESSGMPADRLVLEITETATANDPGGTISRLHELKSLNVGLALDDFGTGYSSLSFLRRFPADYLKIDRSFVSHIATNDSDRAIVRGVIDISHTLGLRTVAEGVESPEQRDILIDLGCDLGQGFLWSRPAPIDELTQPGSGSRDHRTDIGA
jgi:diguanylate cyclase (GGDEF)-like protein/PAS domain S-box-containing protein